VLAHVTWEEWQNLRVKSVDLVLIGCWRNVEENKKTEGII
jgi:hypothetical protein